MGRRGDSRDRGGSRRDTKRDSRSPLPRSSRGHVGRRSADRRQRSHSRGGSTGRRRPRDDSRSRNNHSRGQRDVRRSRSRSPATALPAFAENGARRAEAEAPVTNPDFGRGEVVPAQKRHGVDTWRAEIHLQRPGARSTGSSFLVRAPLRPNKREAEEDVKVLEEVARSAGPEGAAKAVREAVKRLQREMDARGEAAWSKDMS
mmetsp:Transcript_81046/g.160608  ORF Transcript_81046/g.160608 Transcript_81046/m.160608 type:complete len:203 (-) Transcript_81046:37-645(-)